MLLWLDYGGWPLRNLRLHCLQTSNILLSKDHTRAKVADVGLSRVLQNTLSLSMASCPMGTFAYCGERSSRPLQLVVLGLPTLVCPGPVQCQTRHLKYVIQVFVVGCLKSLTVCSACYAAPEVLLGLSCSVKLDMYSFGVVLW